MAYLRPQLQLYFIPCFLYLEIQVLPRQDLVGLLGNFIFKYQHIFAFAICNSTVSHLIQIFFKGIRLNAIHLSYHSSGFTRNLSLETSYDGYISTSRRAFRFDQSSLITLSSALSKYQPRNYGGCIKLIQTNQQTKRWVEEEIYQACTVIIYFQRKTISSGTSLTYDLQ